MDFNDRKSKGDVQEFDNCQLSNGINFRKIINQPLQGLNPFNNEKL
jgi:hypothetical protein